MGFLKKSLKVKFKFDKKKLVKSFSFINLDFSKLLFLIKE